MTVNTTSESFSHFDKPIAMLTLHAISLRPGLFNSTPLKPIKYHFSVQIYKSKIPRDD